MELSSLSPQLVQIVVLVISFAVAILFIYNWVTTGQSPLYFATNILSYFSDQFCGVINQLPGIVKNFVLGGLCK